MDDYSAKFLFLFLGDVNVLSFFRRSIACLVRTNEHIDSFVWISSSSSSDEQFFNLFVTLMSLSLHTQSRQNKHDISIREKKTARSIPIDLLSSSFFSFVISHV